MRRAFVVVVLAGCFRPQPAPQHDAQMAPVDAAPDAHTDAARPDDAVSDSPADGALDAAADAMPPGDAACTWSAFGTPRRIAELATASDEIGPFLSDDRLEIAFTRGSQMFHALRTTAAAPFGPAELFQTGVVGRHYEPWISADGTSVWFSAVPPYAPQSRPFVYSASRAGRSATLTGVAIHVDVYDTGFDLSGGGLDAITSAGIPVDSASILLWHRASPSATFDAPVRLEVGTGVCCGELLGGGAALYTDVIAGKLMRFDGTASAPFAPELGTGIPDGRLTTDRATLVFASDRAGGAGGLDLYEADRTCQ